MSDYICEMTHSIFDWDTKDKEKLKRVYEEAGRMIITMEDKEWLLQKIMDANPHLHYLWETAKDYVGMFATAVPDNASIMECHMLKMLELRNSCWTFSNAEGYNPYWKWTKEQFDAYSAEMNKSENIR